MAANASEVVTRIVFLKSRLRSLVSIDKSAYEQGGTKVRTRERDTAKYASHLSQPLSFYETIVYLGFVHALSGCSRIVFRQSCERCLHFSC